MSERKHFFQDTFSNRCRHHHQYNLRHHHLLPSQRPHLGWGREPSASRQQPPPYNGHHQPSWAGWGGDNDNPDNNSHPRITVTHAEGSDVLMVIMGLFNVQVTFIPNSPPMEVDTRGRDFFQERHLSIGWAVLPSISIDSVWFLHLGWSAFAISAAIRTALKVAGGARICDNPPFNLGMHVTSYL